MNNEMKNEQNNSVRKLRNYGAGALVVLVIGLGVAIILYSRNMIPFDPFNLVAWIFGPLGFYTIIYAYFGGKDVYYYLVFGSIMSVVAIISIMYTLVLPITIIGMLLIVLAIIGIIAYRRNK